MSVSHDDLVSERPCLSATMPGVRLLTTEPFRKPKVLNAQAEAAFTSSSGVKLEKRIYIKPRQTKWYLRITTLGEKKENKGEKDRAGPRRNTTPTPLKTVLWLQVPPGTIRDSPRGARAI